MFSLLHCQTWCKPHFLRFRRDNSTGFFKNNIAIYPNFIDGNQTKVVICRVIRHLLIIVALCFLPGGAHAQMKQKFSIRDGKLVGGTSAAVEGVPAISEAQQLIFQAQKSVMKGDFVTAEEFYTKSIALDGSNTQAYLHRAVIRREQRNYRGMDADARMAYELSNRSVAAKPRDPDGYYDRSLALRLLRHFDQARQDVMTAIQFGGKPSLKNDLQAIELERKIAVSATLNTVQ